MIYIQQMKRFGNVVLFLFFVFQCYILKGQDITNGKKISVLISPVLISFDGFNIGLQPGIQYNSNNKWSVATEVAFLLSKQLGETWEDHHYFRTSAEVKKYFKINKRTSRYISFQTNYAFRNFTNSSGGRFRIEHQSPDSLFLIKQL